MDTVFGRWLSTPARVPFVWLGVRRHEEARPISVPSTQAERLPNTKHHYEPCSGTNLGLGEQVKASQKVSGAQGEQGELAQSPRKCWAALGQGQ